MRTFTHYLDWSGKKDRALCGVILKSKTRFVLGRPKWDVQSCNVNCQKCRKKLGPQRKADD